MSLCNSLEIFQEKMNKLFTGFNYLRAYIHDILVITKESFKEHLKQLDTVLENPGTTGLKRNTAKLCVAAHKLEDLG